MFQAFLPAIPNNPKSILSTATGTPWGNPVCLLERTQQKKEMLKIETEAEGCIPTVTLLRLWTFDTMTHCSLVICCSYCQEGSKCSTLLKVSCSNQCKQEVNLCTYSVIQIRGIKAGTSIRFDKNRKSGSATRKPIISFVYNDESFVWKYQLYEEKT